MNDREPILIQREGIPIPEDQVTPEMRMNAIGSPERRGYGVLQSGESWTDTMADNKAGESVVANTVSVDTDSVETPVIPDTSNKVPGSTTFRSDYWKRPTSEQINEAKARGYDLEKQSKYYS